MKIEDGIDSFSIHVNKNKSIRSNLWYFLKLIMFTIIISISLTLLLVFFTGGNPVDCLPRFNLIVQRKYIDGCLNDGLYGSPRKCDEYYKCENGIPIPVNCPFGTEWSTVEVKCVDRSKSDCSQMFYCPKSFGKFKNSLHCDTFYACYFNQPYLIYCPPPLLWSSKTQDCEWAEDSDCPIPNPTNTTIISSTTTTPATSTTEKVLKCDSSKEQFFADPLDCTGYYFCNDENIAIKFYCASGKGFNSKTLSCNNLELSDCKK